MLSRGWGLRAASLFPSLQPGESGLKGWGKATRGRENMAPATHRAIPGFWWKKKWLALTLLSCKIQMYFDFLEEPRAQVSVGMIPLRTSDLKPKAAWLLRGERTASAVSEVTLWCLGVAQLHDVSLLMGSGLLSNATWKRVVSHRNLSSSSKNFISLKIFNRCLYVLEARLSKSLISVFPEISPWILGQAKNFQLTS